MEFLLLIAGLIGVYFWRKRKTESKKSGLIVRHHPSIQVYLSNMKLFRETTLKAAQDASRVDPPTYDLNIHLAMYMLSASDCALEYWAIPEPLHDDIKTMMLYEMGYDKGQAMGILHALKRPLHDPFTGEIIQHEGYTAFQQAWLKSPDATVAIPAAQASIIAAMAQWSTDSKLQQQLMNHRA